MKYDFQIHEKRLSETPKNQLSLEKSIILAGLNRSPISVLLNTKQIYKLCNSWYQLRHAYFFKYMPKNIIINGINYDSSMYYNGFFRCNVPYTPVWILGFIDNPIENILYFKSIANSEKKILLGSYVIKMITAGRTNYAKIFMEMHLSYIKPDQFDDIILGLSQEQDILIARYIINSAQYNENLILYAPIVAEIISLRKQIVTLLKEKLVIKIRPVYILIAATVIMKIIRRQSLQLNDCLGFISILANEWNKIVVE